MNLREENKKLKVKLKAYESYYGGRIINLCLVCDNPVGTDNKVTVTHYKNFKSKTQGHLHKRCWNDLIK